MNKFFIFVVGIIAITVTTAHAVTRNGATVRSRTGDIAALTGNAATQTAEYTYNYMYPYLSNQMRTDLNPGGTTPSQSANPINAIVRTEQLSAPRRVVARGSTKNTSSAARSAVGGNTSPQSTTAQARAASTPSSGNTTQRRVVARRATNGSAAAARAGTRGQNSYTSRVAANTPDNLTTTGENISSARCLADYTECMNGYCQRESQAYNRCYCSSKLSQIDAQYQPAIDSLIKQIITLRSTNNWSDAEMNEYWMDVIGKYTGENSWVNLENALNIDWAGTESRVRGQQAFATGHEYCVQHLLRGCYYMASNLRDAYRSEIARDCSTYEQSLQKLKNAAESLVEIYK